ncbi:hypothetical protein AVEN_174415-1 [Araneus ventricosus]|uniref:Uncharacterized protein n=1 Tax=Araneus ventricosus TaxID=182803 RepID=A0A4Y2H175_ARAVE|nr:hypothetical protein AVEN_174415-1 [Araneus ventricosus]
MSSGRGIFVTYLHRFRLCSHDRCVCSDKGGPDHYATNCPGRSGIKSKEFEDVPISSREIREVPVKDNPILKIVQFVIEEREYDEEFPMQEEIESTRMTYRNQQYITNKSALGGLDKAEKFSQIFSIDAPSPPWLPFLSYLLAKFLGINHQIPSP